MSDRSVDAGAARSDQPFDRLTIVACHNYYQQRGGEDQVFEDEVALLEAMGHEVITFTRQSREVSGPEAMAFAVRTVWNSTAARELAAIVADTNADIVHMHNWLPMISLAAPIAAREAGAAVVQTLQNYRFACPKGTFFRDGTVCEKCADRRVPWPAVRYGCYRDSRAASAVVGTALAAHRLRGTLTNDIDVYVAASRFTKKKVSSAGLPPDRIMVKPNFLSDDPGAGSGSGAYAMYLGRLSPEKGIITLLDTWNQFSLGVPLKIAGTGPHADLVEQAACRNPNIEYLGFASDEVVDTTLKDAAFLVVPSVNYEGFPKTIVEAFARGTPVVASRLGAMEEAIIDDQTGKLFEPGSSTSLADAIGELQARPGRCAAMRNAVRQVYLDRYTAQRNYAIMMDIYRAARARRRERPEGER